MMYPIVLTLHSFVRWFVLLSLSFAIYHAWNGYFKKRSYTRFDNNVRHWTATIAHIQFMLGFILYIISPVTNYFLQNFREGIHLREIRFFGLEHSTMMFLAIVVISIGSAKAKRRTDDIEKFKTMGIWFAIGLFLILTSIPWPFSPFTSRPYLRF